MTGPPDAVDDPNVTAGIGFLLNLAGEKVRDYVAAWMFYQLGDFEDAAKQLGYTSDELKKSGWPGVVEEDSGTTGGKPFEQGKDMLPPVAQAASTTAEGFVQSAPRMAIAEFNPLLGVYAFGATPDGFDFKQAAFAMFLPAIRSLSGEITAAIVAKMGVSDEVALQAFNKIGGAAGVAALIGADQLNQIWKLPPEQRKQALIDAASNAMFMFVLSLHGETKRPEETKIGKEPAKPLIIPGADLENEAWHGWNSPGLSAKDGVVYSESDAAALSGNPPLGVNWKYAKAITDYVKAKFPGAPDTIVVQSVDQLPPDFRAQVRDGLAQGKIRSALYDTHSQTAWLVADLLPHDPVAIKWIAYEEMIGHPAMEPLLKQQDYRQLYDDIRTHKPEKFAQLWHDYDVGNISDPDAQMRKIVGEYVAKEAPRLDDSDPLWQRVHDTLLRSLKSVGMLPKEYGGAALDARMRAIARKAGDQLRATPMMVPRPSRTSDASDESQNPQPSRPDNGAGVSFSQSSDSLGKWVDKNGGGLSEKDNIQRGQRAMDRAIRSGSDVQKAMYRQGIGQIDFKWGTPGTKQPDEQGRTYKEGEGISHILEKHPEFARDLPEAIAKGKIIPHDKEPDKRYIVYQGKLIVLRLESSRNAYVVTGFDDANKTSELENKTKPAWLGGSN
jgi:hypothetical protein